MYLDIHVLSEGRFKVTALTAIHLALCYLIYGSAIGDVKVITCFIIIMFLTVLDVDFCIK